jgi:hypothetical protein
MKRLLIIFTILYLPGCQQIDHNRVVEHPLPAQDSLKERSYDKIKENIAIKRKEFAIKYPSLNHSSQTEICDYWVTAIGEDLYNQWQGTPWDFNGTTTRPQQGAIACGYFVTTLLQDMDLQINRVQLSVCASSQMMKRLTPHQKIRNLSYLAYADFSNTLKESGKGVYIIGLDFHTGFIVNDGTENWFIHSNYIGRKGVTKEPVMSSAALQASKTRWLISLTDDQDFLERWLKG